MLNDLAKNQLENQYASVVAAKRRAAEKQQQQPQQPTPAAVPAVQPAPTQQLIATNLPGVANVPFRPRQR